MSDVEAEAIEQAGDEAAAAADLERRARELHARAVVIDGHSDILIPIAGGHCRFGAVPGQSELIQWGRLAAALPRPEARADLPYELPALAELIACTGQYHLPQLLQGGVSAATLAIHVRDKDLDHALAEGLAQAAALHRELDANWEQTSLVLSAADIRQAKADGRLGILASVEGAEPFGRHLHLLEAFYRLGVRLIGLAHSRRNAFCDGTQLNIKTGGLTALGKRAVKLMDDLGIIIDLAHMADAGFWEIIELARGPVVLSHTSAIKPSPGYRAPLDEVNATYGMSKAQAIARKQGLIGVIFWGQADIGALADEIEMLARIAGPENVGLGSDYYGLDAAPKGLTDPSQLPDLTLELVRRGLPDAWIEGALGGNWLRVIEQILG